MRVIQALWKRWAYLRDGLFVWELVRGEIRHSFNFLPKFTRTVFRTRCRMIVLKVDFKKKYEMNLS